MKRLNYLILFVSAILLLPLLSCNKDRAEQLALFDEISDIATFHGNLEGNVVVVNTQGGPGIELEDDGLLDIISESQTQSALYVNVHQVQTKNPSLFTGTEITFEEAKEYDLQSIENLKRAVEFFTNQEDKTVYVLGISFGAFMTQELIATHGIDVADGYMISVGRLDIDEDTWQPFSQGQYTEYLYDNNGNFTINSLGDGSDIELRNMARLAAGLGYNRYTNKLSSIGDLSKITYVYGDRDEQVGPLSDQEIQFLTAKGANVLLSEGGNHDIATSLSLSLLKEAFGIE